MACLCRAVSIKLPKDHNAFDALAKEFLAEYKYELLASFALLFVLGGIVLAVKVVDQQKSAVEVVPAESATSAVEQKLIVEISGAVATPGVYEIEAEARVDDLINLAGGLTKEANTAWVEKNLNRAEVLSDGQKVYLPTVGETEAQAAVAGTSVSSKVNLNTASQAELESLPGIGPTYAERIIAARPFRSVEQLLSVSGIGAKKYTRLKELVTVH